MDHSWKVKICAFDRPIIEIPKIGLVFKRAVAGNFCGVGLFGKSLKLFEQSQG